MHVAKYWRNKRLRYRLVRDKRTRQAEISNVDSERVTAAVTKADEKPVVARQVK